MAALLRGGVAWLVAAPAAKKPLASETLGIRHLEICPAQKMKPDADVRAGPGMPEAALAGLAGK